MRSRTVHLPGGPCPRELLLAAAAEAGRPPDFVLAFLPPEEQLRETLAAHDRGLAGRPALRLRGGDPVRRRRDDQRRGTVQLFWFDDPAPPRHGGGDPRHPRRAADRRGGSRPWRAASPRPDGALLLVDGLRFPVERFLAELRRTLVERAAARGRRPRLAGRAGDPGRRAGVRGRAGAALRLPGGDPARRRHAGGGGARLEPGLARLYGDPRRGERRLRDRRRAGHGLVPPLLHRRRRARPDARRGQPLPADRRGAAAGAPGALPQPALLRPAAGRRHLPGGHRDRRPGAARHGQRALPGAAPPRSCRRGPAAGGRHPLLLRRPRGGAGRPGRRRRRRRSTGALGGVAALRLLHLRRDRPHAARQPRLLQPHRHPGAAARGGRREDRSARARQRDPAQPAGADDPRLRGADGRALRREGARPGHPGLDRRRRHPHRRRGADRLPQPGGRAADRLGAAPRRSGGRCPRSSSVVDESDGASR